MIAKPARTTHLEIRLVQPRQRMLVRRTLRRRAGVGGARVGRWVSESPNRQEKKQRVRLRRKRARVRVSRDETKYRLPRARLAPLCRRHRISRGLSRVTQAFCPSIARSRPTPSPVVAKTPPPPFRMARRVRCVCDRSSALSRRSDLKGLQTAPCGFPAFFASPEPHAHVAGSARGGGVCHEIFNIRFGRSESAHA